MEFPNMGRKEADVHLIEVGRELEAEKQSMYRRSSGTGRKTGASFTRRRRKATGKNCSAPKSSRCG